MTNGAGAAVSAFVRKHENPLESLPETPGYDYMSREPPVNACNFTQNEDERETAAPVASPPPSAPGDSTPTQFGTAAEHVEE